MRNTSIGILLLTVAINAQTNTQLDKSEILKILTSSAQTSKASAKRIRYKDAPKTNVLTQKSPNGTQINANSFKEAEIASGIILPNKNAGIQAIEKDPYAYLPQGSLPEIGIKKHYTDNGISLEKRYSVISGQPIVTTDKIKVARQDKETNQEKKASEKVQKDPVAVLY